MDVYFVVFIVCIAFFVTVIALIAIVFGKPDIATKAITALSHTLKALSGNLPKSD